MHSVYELEVSEDGKVIDYIYKEFPDLKTAIKVAEFYSDAEGKTYRVTSEED